jgi:hypothetical protein
MSEPDLPLWRPPGDADDENAIPSDAQKVFDTVTGPNLRLSDNLIQLAAIAAGTLVGALAGTVYVRSTGTDTATGAVLGGFAGLVLSLLLSGFVIGLVRAILAVKPSPRADHDAD